jgi:hypothetical protein
VDEAAIALNDHTYPSFEGGVTYDPGWSTGWIFAAAVHDRYDPRYDYQDERRTTATTDVIVAERFIRTRGLLHAASLGAAVPLPGRTSLGLALHRYFGTLEDRDALVPHGTTSGAVVTERERRLRGYSATVGATARLDERLTLALAVETTARLDADATETRDDSVVVQVSGRDVRLPWRLQAGMAYRPRNTFRTTFALDVVYQPWTELRDDLIAGQALMDTWDVRLGVEHVYYNALPGRIGFRYLRSYQLREADLAALTFGIGYRVVGFDLDVAAEIGRRVSYQDPLWPRVQQGPAVGAGRDRVEDTVARVSFEARTGF